MAEGGDQLAHAWPLLRELAAGEALHGEAAAAQLGLSRAAIWKQVETLRAAGLTVDADPGRGYRLSSPLELLDAGRIADAAGIEDEAVEVLRITDSTNRLVSELEAPHGAVRLAEAQRAGRGRRGRSWVSPLGAGLWLSLGWRFDTVPAGFAGLSLVVGVAVAQALSSAGAPGARLKWPNDLVVPADGAVAKLGGILVEVNGEAAGPVTAVIGIGLNHRLPEVDLGLDQPACDLRALCDPPPSRNLLAGAILRELFVQLPRFEAQGLAASLDGFRELDVMVGREITVTAADGSRTRGRYLGVADDGAVRLATAAGERALHSGELVL